MKGPDQQNLHMSTSGWLFLIIKCHLPGDHSLNVWTYLSVLIIFIVLWTLSSFSTNFIINTLTPTSGAGEWVFRTPHVPRPTAGRGFGAGLFPVLLLLLWESCLSLLNLWEKVGFMSCYSGILMALSRHYFLGFFNKVTKWYKIPVL